VLLFNRHRDLEQTFQTIRAAHAAVASVRCNFYAGADADAAGIHS